MKRKRKRTLSWLVSIVMLVVAFVPVFPRSLTTTASAAKYKKGDIIAFGGYPQTKVEDEELIEELNALPAEWVRCSDYYEAEEKGTLLYCDVVNHGVKFRGVQIVKYRDWEEYERKNGYYRSNVYWFCWKSLNWKVLDPATGFVVCEGIIDSQPFCNDIYWDADSECFNDEACEHYANDWETSMIRRWLNNGFYKMAFSEDEQANIGESINKNKGILSEYDPTYDGNTTTDLISLLSYSEMCELDSEDYWACDLFYNSHPTDYAQCLGLVKGYDFYYSEDSDWWTRTAGERSSDIMYVGAQVPPDKDTYVWNTSLGVRPAFRFKNGIVESLYQNPDHTVHNWKLVESEKSNCFETGFNRYRCVFCCEEKYENIPLTDHEFGPWEEVRYTSLIPGPDYGKNIWRHRRICSVCRTAEEEEHTWNKGKVTMAATCETDGVKTYTCTVCKATKTEKIPATGHAFGEWKELNENEHQRTCANDPSHVETAAHTWNKGKVTTAATCEIDGVKTYTCTVCKATRQEKIPAKGHAFGEWKELNENEHQRVCANDPSHIETAEHNWDDGKVAKEPAPGVEGERQFVCKDCDAVKTEPIDALPVETEAPTTEPPTTEGPTTEAPTTEPGEAVYYTLGDVNMDGKINSADARLALRAAAKVETLSQLQELLADVDENGKLKAADARTILRISARLEPKPEKQIPVA